MIFILIIIFIFIIYIFVRRKKPIIEDTKPEEKTTEALLNVPYQKVQGKDWCLPASGAMIYKYYGKDISQSNIAKDIIKDGVSSIFKMISHARGLGFEAKFNYIDIEEIEELLREGAPPIVIQKYSISIKNSHCRVIIGFDNKKEELTLHDSAGKCGYRLSYKSFFELNFDNSKKTKIITIKGKEQ